MSDIATWKARLDRHALPVSLGVLLLAVLVVAAGVQVAPEKFYDRFVWEDIWGPLVVDAFQCRSSLACPGVEGPAGIPAKDGYTVTSELVYGGILAVLLYGIYVGLFRRYAIVADGRFVFALLPWIMLGPLARALEDANVFCQAGTDCAPSPFAYLFISPVIYIHIALYVIAGLLLGVLVQRHRDGNVWLLTALVGSALGMGFSVFGFVASQHADWFHALPPIWVMLLVCTGAAGVFHVRAMRGGASANLTVFVLGLPFALASVWYVATWLSGDVWSREAWNGEFHFDAGLTILGLAIGAVLLVWGLSRVLSRPGVESSWARVATRLGDERLDARLLYAGLAALFGAALLSGMLPRLDAFVPDFALRARLVGPLAIAGVLALVAAAFVHVGQEIPKRTHVLAVFGLGINLALVFGHVIDGSATWLALEDPFGFGLPTYAEKHPFSDFLLKFWDGLLFPVAKIVMVLVVVWLLDREFKESTADERNLVGLIKMAIFVLGFAPGLRDLLRVTMGV